MIEILYLSHYQLSKLSMTLCSIHTFSSTHHWNPPNNLVQEQKNSLVQLLQLGHPLINKLMNKVHHAQVIDILAMILIEIILEYPRVPLKLQMQSIYLSYSLWGQPNFSHHRVRHWRIERGACMGASRPLGIYVRVDSCHNIALCWRGASKQPDKHIHREIYCETKVDNDCRAIEVRGESFIVEFDVWEIPVKWEVFDNPEVRVAGFIAEETVLMELFNNGSRQDMVEVYMDRYHNP